MTIFVERASECLTDHMPHGDGLICYSLLRGLVDRGHRIYAYTNRHDFTHQVPGLFVRSGTHRLPANSLADWEHRWRARHWLRQVGRRERVDLVWRMHPYGIGCPTVPYSGGRPLVIGPVFYAWPAEGDCIGLSGRPRLGLGLGPIVAPLARRGWRRTLRKADLVMCATDQLATSVRPLTNGRVATLPVIVDPPAALIGLRQPAPVETVRLLFVANLTANKRADAFCRIVATVRAAGVAVMGTILGDGPDRSALERWCRDHDLDRFMRFVGRVSNADVFGYMAAADLLVSTSVGEPYGRGIVEAMSVGTPALCHRSGGPADLITADVDGLLVERSDDDAYADAIVRAYRAGLLPNLGLAAARRALPWRSTVVLDSVEALLNELCRTTQSTSNHRH